MEFNIKIAAGAGLSALALVACSIFEPEAECQMNLGVGIIVEVLDQQTGLPAAAGATLVIRPAPYADSVRYVPANAEGSLARLIDAPPVAPGSYTVLIRKPGYSDWIAEGVQVRKTRECGDVITTRLLARLEPVG